jgi:hypothetical protein
MNREITASISSLVFQLKHCLQGNHMNRETTSSIFAEMCGLTVAEFECQDAENSAEVALILAEYNSPDARMRRDEIAAYDEELSRTEGGIV